VAKGEWEGGVGIQGAAQGPELDEGGHRTIFREMTWLNSKMAESREI
jgi:hypothetical protein